MRIIESLHLSILNVDTTRLPELRVVADSFSLMRIADRLLCTGLTLVIRVESHCLNVVALEDVLVPTHVVIRLGGALFPRRSIAAAERISSATSPICCSKGQAAAECDSSSPWGSSYHLASSVHPCRDAGGEKTT